MRTRALAVAVILAGGALSACQPIDSGSTTDCYSVADVAFSKSRPRPAPRRAAPPKMRKPRKHRRHHGFSDDGTVICG